MARLTKVIAEHECGVLFRLGKPLEPPRGPGRVWLIPRVYQLEIVDLRPTAIDIAPLEAMAKDGVPVSVSAHVLAQVVNPTDAVMRVVDWKEAISQLTETALRAFVKEQSRDEALYERAELEARVTETVVEPPLTCT